MSELASKDCVPCKGGMPPLKGEQLHALSHQLPNWNVVHEHHITRAFPFPDFKQALDFVNRVGAVAEEQGHHPDILLKWGSAEITIWTHKIDGLTESDFVMAAKIDSLYPVVSLNAVLGQRKERRNTVTVRAARGQSQFRAVD